MKGRLRGCSTSMKAAARLLDQHEGPLRGWADSRK
jgi:hypothetical protein